jgi:hypothetical protein
MFAVVVARNCGVFAGLFESLCGALERFKQFIHAANRTAEKN